LAEDDKYHDLVAVKVLNPKRTRKITEPDIMKELQHPNIVQLRKHFIIDEQQYIVVEFAENGDLCDYTYNNEYLEEAEARKFMAQIVEAVSYMHDQGICHRDLKLDNIFLDRHNDIRIGDFGASTYFDQEKKLTYRCGTTQYNAPELVKNQGYWGDEIDCWSVGVVLYVMLCGRFPFEADTDLGLLYQILKGLKYPKKPKLSAEVKDLIESLMEPDPNNRATLDEVRDHPWLLGEKL